MSALGPSGIPPQMLAMFAGGGGMGGQQPQPGPGSGIEAGENRDLGAAIQSMLQFVQTEKDPQDRQAALQIIAQIHKLIAQEAALRDQAMGGSSALKLLRKAG